MYAAKENNHEIVKELLKMDGIDVNAQGTHIILQIKHIAIDQYSISFVWLVFSLPLVLPLFSAKVVVGAVIFVCCCVLRLASFLLFCLFALRFGHQ